MFCVIVCLVLNVVSVRVSDDARKVMDDSLCTQCLARQRASHRLWFKVVFQTLMGSPYVVLRPSISFDRGLPEVNF